MLGTYLGIYLPAWSIVVTVGIVSSVCMGTHSNGRVDSRVE